MRILTRSIVIAVTFAVTVRAQKPTPSVPVANPAEAVAPAVVLPAPPADFIYNSDGRRDPFISLLKHGADAPGVQVKRIAGVAGLQTAEIAVRGIVQNRGTWAAIVKGPDGKVYTVRAGDRLLDGTVHSVTAQFVAVVQEVKDPLSLEKQREVRKYLRGGEEVK